MVQNIKTSKTPEHRNIRWWVHSLLEKSVVQNIRPKQYYRTWWKSALWINRGFVQHHWAVVINQWSYIKYIMDRTASVEQVFIRVQYKATSWNHEYSCKQQVLIRVQEVLFSTSVYPFSEECNIIMHTASSMIDNHSRIHIWCKKNRCDLVH